MNNDVFDFLLQEWSEEELRDMSKGQLQEMCASLDLDDSGTKKELIKRLLSEENVEVLEAESQISIVKGTRV